MESSGDLGDSPEFEQREPARPESIDRDKRLKDELSDKDALQKTRSGRNVPMAITVGLSLGVVIVASLLLWRFSFVIIIALAIAIGSIELISAFRKSAGLRTSMIPILLGGQAIIWTSWVWGLSGVLVSLVLTLLASLLWRIPAGSENYLRDVSASVFAVGYLPLSGAFAAMLVLPTDGVGRVLAFLIGVTASDTGGFVAGVLKGKHPMAPSISPRKTWEGFGGSVLAGLLAGALTFPLLLDAQVWQGMIFGIAITLTATAGDLIESLIKRDLKVKDMGNLLPGHGGMMDRLDSLLPSAVVSWLLLSVFV